LSGPVDTVETFHCFDKFTVLMAVVSACMFVVVAIQNILLLIKDSLIKIVDYCRIIHFCGHRMLWFSLITTRDILVGI